MVDTAGCSCRRLRINSQYPPVTPVPGNRTPPLTSTGTRNAHGAYTIHVGKRSGSQINIYVFKDRKWLKKTLGTDLWPQHTRRPAQMWIHTKRKHTQKITCTHKKIKAKQSLTLTHGLQNATFLVWAQTRCEVFVSAVLPTEQMSHLRRQVPSDNVNAALLLEAGSMGSSYQKERQQGICVRQIPIALLREGTCKCP